MSKRQALHSKIRSSKEWKEFRKFMGTTYSNGMDALTDQKLRPGWNLHHCSLKDEEYDKFEPYSFVCLNRKSHDCVHFLWGKDGRNWKKKVANLVGILQRMEELNLNSDK